MFDGLGSVVALTDSSGAVVDSYACDPYGNITSQTQQVANPFKWIGAVYDQATGLYKMGARYYDPQIARWTQMDPGYSGSLDDPQSLNRYAYSEGSPVTYADPGGLALKDFARQFWRHFTVNALETNIITYAIGGAVTGAIGGGIPAIPMAVLGAAAGAMMTVVSSALGALLAP